MNTNELLEMINNNPELFELIKGYTEMKDQESKSLVLKIIKRLSQ